MVERFTKNKKLKINFKIYFFNDSLVIISTLGNKFRFLKTEMVNKFNIYKIMKIARIFL